MKIRLIAHNVLGVILALILLIGCFSAAFFITAFIYTKVGRLQNNFISQLINFLIGAIMALVILKVMESFDKNAKGLFDTIIKAQNKIAVGDFNVNLNKSTERLGPFGDLMDSVNNMASELSRMEKMRQEFISNVSHEIQSPLTSIRGFTQALRNNNLSPENRLRYLNIIEDESMRLSRLSDNLLKLSSLEADTMKFEPGLYRLDRQLRNIVLACEPQWSDKQINMDICFEEVEINADQDLLSQIWINLINNAIKFTPEGGSIKLNLKCNSCNAEFCISDTGTGIPKEEQARIFERFYKADKSRSPAIKGSGLGLAIVRRIIDMHKGTIEVQSTPGTGTTFTVSLPLNN